MNNLFSADFAQTAVGTKQRKNTVLEFCPVCGKLVIDQENIEAINDWGMCMICDHVKGEVYAGEIDDEDEYREMLKNEAINAGLTEDEAENAVEDYIQ